MWRQPRTGVHGWVRDVQRVWGDTIAITLYRDLFTRMVCQKVVENMIKGLWKCCGNNLFYQDYKMVIVMKHRTSALMSCFIGMVLDSVDVW